MYLYKDADGWRLYKAAADSHRIRMPQPRDQANDARSNSSGRNVRQRLESIRTTVAVPVPVLPGGRATQRMCTPLGAPAAGRPLLDVARPAKFSAVEVEGQTIVLDKTAEQLLWNAAKSLPLMEMEAGTTGSQEKSAAALPCPFCSTNCRKATNHPGRKSNQLLKWYSRYGYMVRRI